MQALVMVNNMMLCYLSSIVFQNHYFHKYNIQETKFVV